MLDLLVDCAIFGSVKAGKGNLYQLGGIPVSELQPLSQAGNKETSTTPDVATTNAELRPSEISFVRSRMLYARAALNARGLVHFGLRHIRTSTLPRVNSTTLSVILRCFESLPCQGPNGC